MRLVAEIKSQALLLLLPPFLIFSSIHNLFSLSTQMSKAIVYIEEMDSIADVTFPAVPQVVSLLMYDDTAKSKENPHPPTGYPVVCVTVRLVSACFCPTYSFCALEHARKLKKIFNSGK